MRMPLKEDWNVTADIYHGKMGTLEEHAHVSFPIRDQNWGIFRKSILSREKKLGNKGRQSRAIIINCLKAVIAGKDFWSGLRLELVDDTSPL
jgi:hypothetical protein